MGIDYSGNCSWHTRVVVWSGVWGGFYLDAKTLLLIILALPGAPGLPEAQWEPFHSPGHVLSHSPLSPWE